MLTAVFIHNRLKKMKIIGVIPAHMASVRFPGKILTPLHGLPMIEHVRRRAKMSNLLSDVIVATCDKSIAKVIQNFGGKVIMTSNTHKNGTTRVAEALQNIECTHVLLLQGDEPLILPRHIDKLINIIENDKLSDAWNATGPINLKEELDRHSFVKCAVGLNNQILYCFRRSPSHNNLESQKVYFRKILGLIAYKKNFLLEISKKEPSPIEVTESIEQMRIIENGFVIRAIDVQPSLPSINEPHEVQIVLNYINSNLEQKKIITDVIRK
jgi:3-deoxy-manno-octulosonate cytidylyltransferase (CMP-KDO synthetase)